jgi:hypothetical protein
MQRTYGSHRIQQAFAEFCRWNPALAGLSETHGELFRAWLLFDWTPDANDSQLPAAIRPEQTPIEVWTSAHPDVRISPHLHFSFFQLETTPQPHACQLRNLMTEECFILEWPTDLPRPQARTIFYALVSPTDIKSKPSIIAKAPEVFPATVGEQLRAFRSKLSPHPLSSEELRTFAVELFDVYHALRVGASLIPAQSPEELTSRFESSTAPSALKKV